MFTPRLALASLSGESDASWARAGTPYAGLAFLGGIAICPHTRRAARQLVARDREEFLPPDPLAFIEQELEGLANTPIRVGWNLRTTEEEPLVRAAERCVSHDAIVEINAHCRQQEVCAVGAGESLLADTDRLARYVRIAADTGADVGVKVRAEVPGVDLQTTARAIERAGATAIHVDAMDSEEVIGPVAEAADLFVIANNGVRDAATTRTYLDLGADAVSVGRPSDRPEILRRVAETTETWFGEGVDQRPATTDRKRSPR